MKFKTNKEGDRLLKFKTRHKDLVKFFRATGGMDDTPEFMVTIREDFGGEETSAFIPFDDARALAKAILKETEK